MPIRLFFYLVQEDRERYGRCLCSTSLIGRSDDFSRNFVKDKAFGDLMPVAPGPGAML